MIIKPDAVERGLVGEILGRLEAKGLHLVAAELRRMPLETAERHYDEHQGKPFFAELLEFITRSPVARRGGRGPRRHARDRAGTDGGHRPQARRHPGPSVATSATELPDNLVHGSDSPEAAAREIALFFPSLG